jgi:hypothetical protein
MKERTVEQDKQMSLRFEPSTIPSDAVPSTPEVRAPSPPTIGQRTAVVVQMPLPPVRATETSTRDSELLGRILNRVRLF